MNGLFSRQRYYVWLRRYKELGVDGPRDRSRRPHVSPKATKAEVVDRIIYLRQHCHFGPLKISMYLKRYHDIVVSPYGGRADPAPPRSQPAAYLPALQAPQGTMEAL